VSEKDTKDPWVNGPRWIDARSAWPELSSPGSWLGLSPQDGAQLLAVLEAPWWVAGGWALDLHLGRVTRAHTDLDIGIFRRDAAKVLAALPGWEIFEARNGSLTQLPEGRAPRAEVNSLWCRRANAEQWALELMLDECDGESWVFRRDVRITRPLASLTQRNPDAIAYLAPEIQLLYKARATRTQDQADFERIVPHLAHDARTWLRESLSLIAPEHAWILMLRGLP
jgi:hypothetical protein